MRKRARLILFIVCILISATVAIIISLSAQSFAVTQIDFIGRAIFPTGSPFGGTEIGGLS
ncbi:MAG TPA: PEP-CTERM sorting domain-containing protein, partial [Microcoleaceae bacterium UBA10368]|nr:PEP-CTERM sorting domain-containing protein [Microcoleaceae cyanobacterium UBA10368]